MLCLAIADYWVMVLVAFPTFVSPPIEFHIQCLPEHDARMRASSCGGIMFSLQQNVLDLVHGITIQDLVVGTQFESVLASLAIRRAEKLNLSVEGCFGWYHYEF